MQNFGRKAPRERRLVSSPEPTCGSITAASGLKAYPNSGEPGTKASNAAQNCER